MIDNQKSINTEQQDKCPLCGKDARVEQSKYKYDPYLLDDEWGVEYWDKTTFHCDNCHYETMFILPLAEARARFRQKPESVEAKILKELKDYINSWPDDTMMRSDKVKYKMQQIEKELKG